MAKFRAESRWALKIERPKSLAELSQGAMQALIKGEDVALEPRREISVTNR